MSEQYELEVTSLIYQAQSNASLALGGLTLGDKKALTTARAAMMAVIISLDRLEAALTAD